MKNNVFDILKKADEMYTIGMPWLTDDDYDSLKDMAMTINPNHPYFKEVGFTPKKKTVKLPYILGSLKKIDNINKWFNNIKDKIVVSEKIDGVSILVTYFNYEVIFASTRGDGEEGTDITNKAHVFCNECETKEKIVLRGEVTLKENVDPLEYNYKNKRNMVSGILNRDDNKYCDLLEVWFYEIIEIDEIIETEHERLNKIVEFGLKTPRFILIDNVDNLEEILSIYKKDAHFDIDGLVLTKNKSERENVKYPKNKVKFKINSDAILTKVKDVSLQVGRTGVIIPVINIEPVEIDGVTVSKATGFNYKFIIDNNITPGTEVMILRSGDVIPYITEVKKNNDIKLDIIKNCPSCGSEVVMKGVHLVCENINCSSSSLRKTAFFLKTLGTNNITEKTLEKLEIYTIEGLFDISEMEMTEFDGIGLNKASLIYNQIWESINNVKPERLLASFGIPNVSIELSNLIVKNLDITGENFIKIFDVTYKDLVLIKGIGDKIAEKFCNSIGYYKDLYLYLKTKGLTFKKDIEKSPINGKIFTLTGAMPLKRDEIVRLIENFGGEVKNITKKTDFLVNGEPNKESTKVKKAVKYGIKIISFEDFINNFKLEEEIKNKY